MTLQAYHGNEPYVFISYAHKDTETLLPLLEQLSEIGLNIWYDEGIRLGSEWPAELANALDGAAGVFMFLSKAYAASANCRNEANYALNAEKPILRVELEQVHLPLRISLRIQNLPQVNMYEAGGWETLQGIAREFISQTERRLTPSFEIKNQAVPPEVVKPSRRIKIVSSGETTILHYKPDWKTGAISMLVSLFCFLVSYLVLTSLDDDKNCLVLLLFVAGLYFFWIALGYLTFRTKLWFENDELHLEQIMLFRRARNQIPLRTLRLLKVENNRLLAETTSALKVIVCQALKPVDDGWYLKAQLENRIAQMDFGDRLMPAMGIPAEVSIETGANSLVIEHLPQYKTPKLLKTIFGTGRKTRLEIDHSVLQIQKDNSSQKTEIPISQILRLKIVEKNLYERILSFIKLTNDQGGPAFEPVYSLMVVKDDLSEAPLIESIWDVYTVGFINSKLQSFLEAIPPEQQPFAQTQLAAAELLPPPFVPARGDRPFIAVSHTQADAAQVYPILEALHQADLEVWFDDGTTTDPRLRAEKAAQAMQQCGLAIYMVSPRSADALHCRNEIHFARNHGKQVVTIYLEEAKLPGGLILRIGDLPFVSKESFDTEQDFMAAVAMAADNLDTSPPGVPASQPTTTDVALGGSLDDVPIHEGEGAYLFASFATSDRAVVAPIAQVFHQAGLPIWYDNGQTNSQTRSTALEQATYVLLFISPTSLRSEQIQAELHTALDQHKSFIVIHLEEAWPPPGLALRLGDFQAILKYRLSEPQFAQELEQGISILREKLHDQVAPQQLDTFSDRGRRAQGKLAEMTPPGGIKVKHEGNRLLILEEPFEVPVTCTGAVLIVWLLAYMLGWRTDRIIAEKDSIRVQGGKKAPKVLVPTHQIEEFITFKQATRPRGNDSGEIVTFEVYIRLKNGGTVILWNGLRQEKQATYIVQQLVNFYVSQDV